MFESGDFRSVEEAQRRMLAAKAENSSGIVGEGVKFERTRRITGYLSPATRWNDAKKAELRDRVKHGKK